MENLQLVLPEIFLSLSIMFLLILGVFKKNSSSMVYNLSIFILIILVFISCQKDLDSTDQEGTDTSGLNDSENSSGTTSSKYSTPCVDGFAGKYPCNGYDLSLIHI